MGNETVEVKTVTGQPVEGTSAPIKFTKSQILKSARYSARKDALSVLLEEDKLYSHEDVAKILDKFLKKKVK